MAHSVTISFPDSSAQAPSTETFTCITCHMIFKDGVGQRDHYRSDVHRFNTKRKVAGLAPVSAEVYDSKQKGTHLARKALQFSAYKHARPKVWLLLSSSIPFAFFGHISLTRRPQLQLSRMQRTRNRPLRTQLLTA